MILKDMLIMKNTVMIWMNVISFYICHDLCLLTYTKREDRLYKCGLVLALQLTHTPSSLSLTHTLESLSNTLSL